MALSKRLPSPPDSWSRSRRLRYRLVRSLFRLLGHIPLRCLDAVLVPFVAWLLRSVIRYRRKMIERNLRLAMPEQTESERRRTVRRCFSHLARLIVYQSHYAYGSDEELQSLFRLEHTDLADRLRAAGHRQVILLLGHIGPWELLGSSAIHLDRSRYRLDVIYKRLTDPLFDRLLCEMREQHYAHCIEMNQLPRLLLHRTEGTDQDRMHVYCLLADQTPRGSQVQYATPFFGTPTPFITGWAQLAVRLQLPVIFFGIRYDSAARQWVGDLQLLEEHPTAELQDKMIDRYAQMLETNIRLAPHHWLWSYNRWVHDLADYPHLRYSPQCRP